ncbi:hypothetical protein [Pseudalkalibacillus berkeleyi]|uniref:Uncharacterized protein n=1 Tax=Pseudalkalibacillus berkeleyi TaxID=1069813 RepID=A0ABS9H3B3_9BACL|nr:hypothetical protein [Pseudalkalibacillus berkeleyi]MCF6138404.1 hypothetical protein [Pseudalkalibacillus berkeleyi]
MELARRINIPVHKYLNLFIQMIEENERYFRAYRVRALIWSFFTPIIMFVPSYLLLASFDTFNFTSVIQFILAIILLITWIAFPGIFLYVNADFNKASWVWMWIWLSLSCISLIVWIIFLL